MRRSSWVLCAFSLLVTSAFARNDHSNVYLIKAFAKDKHERTRIADAGLAIDGILSDSVTIFGTDEDIARLKKINVPIEVVEMPGFADAFPTADGAFHDYQEMQDALNKIVTENSDIASLVNIGKSVEGRDLLGVRLSSGKEMDSLPTAIFMGCHHAREHLSVEVPLKIAQHLVDNYDRDSRIKSILDTTEVYIIPMVNPDGAEHDISTGNYKMWRKNRKKNADGTYGVDLNRNYGSHWGGPGSSSSTNSDTYKGTAPFSEPETQAVRDFVRARKKTTVLLSFHTFSELVLWPYGWTNDEIANSDDRKVFETMGKKMATWNKYTPQKSSELYLASGDTTDWAYDELKIFAFTFELSPSSMFGGGFYPGAKAIEPTFKANLEPALYLMENTPNPYGVLNNHTDPLGMLN